MLETGLLVFCTPGNQTVIEINVRPAELADAALPVSSLVSEDECWSKQMVHLVGNA